MAYGRKTGGRVLGTPNKGTAEIKELARLWGPAALQKAAALAGLVKDEDGEIVGMAASETAQILALKEILDRAYGKAPQHLSVERSPFGDMNLDELRSLVTAARQAVDPDLGGDEGDRETTH